jgi:hypothetical protein
MIAFKIFSQCPTNQKPAGIPDVWPWQEVAIPIELQSSYESMGFTVETESNYAAYKSSNQAAFTAWMVSQTAQLTKAAIEDRLATFQQRAPALIRDLMAVNTMAGISAAQSDQMFDDYADVLMRIREGAFPTALRKLLFKRPSGFVTQILLDQWIEKIQGASA